MPLQEGANNGTWILLKIGGKVLGGQTNLNFESTADTIDTTTKLSKDARKTVLIGEFAETLSIEGIVQFKEGVVDASTANWQYLYNAYIKKQEIPFDIVQDLTPDESVSTPNVIGSGKLLLTSAPFSAPKNGVVTFSSNAHINEFTPAAITVAAAQ